jgi:hypothetical protein
VSNLCELNPRKCLTQYLKLRELDFFCTDYGQHFLEDLDHDSFGSDLGSPSKQQKQSLPSSKTPTAGKKYSYSPVPTPKYSLGQPTAGQKSYVTSKYKKVPSQYNVLPYQGLYTENLPKKHTTDIILPAYSAQGGATPNFGTRKYTTELVQQTPATKHGSEKLKYFTEKYRSGDEFGFGGEGIY